MYPRALRNEWEYDRLKPSWWLGLLFNASVTGTSDDLMRKHPIVGVVDPNFTRPLVPFSCAAGTQLYTNIHTSLIHTYTLIHT
jgi:hypothetical protein